MRHPSTVIVALALSLGLASAAGAEGETAGRSEDLARRHDLSPTFSLYGFADVTLRGESVKGAGSDTDTSSGFAIGALDLFILSRLADNLSFLGELVFETNDDGDFVVDLERLALKYTVSDRFWASVGRHHTALGYWNEAFHHGLILQPVVERPAVLQFEDDGGVLPVHSVGLTVGGRWFRGHWGLDYEGDISNGRGALPDDVQNLGDQNDSKSVTARLTVSRDGEVQVLFGAMARADTIPPNPDPTLPDRNGSIDESIVGGHFVYRDRRLEVFAEYYDIRHGDSVSGADFDHRGYFAIAIRRSGRWRPYAGYDRLDLEDGDPYYAGFAASTKRLLAGVRLDASPLNAIKFEYQHDDAPAGGETDALVVQASFTF
jgi:hypothetical protein